MEVHPTFTALEPLVSRYSPSVQGAAFQTYNDLLLSQRWCDLRVFDLPACGRCAFEGVPLNSGDYAIAVPCALAESISLDWLDGAFEGTNRPAKIFLAIVSDDSSVVYYKWTAGINKPPV